MVVPDDWDVHGFGLALADLRPGMIRLARSRGLQVADAEDAVQDATMRLFVRCAQGRTADIQNVEAYFTRVVLHKIVDHYRAAERAGTLFDRLASDFATRSTSLSGDEAALIDLLGRVDAVHASAFLLVEYFGFTQDQAAKILGRSQGTISGYVDLAKSSLSGLLDEEPR